MPRLSAQHPHHGEDGLLAPICHPGYTGLRIFCHLLWYESQWFSARRLHPHSMNAFSCLHTQFLRTGKYCSMQRTISPASEMEPQPRSLTPALQPTHGNLIFSCQSCDGSESTLLLGSVQQLCASYQPLPLTCQVIPIHSKSFDFPVSG